MKEIIYKIKFIFLKLEGLQEGELRTKLETARKMHEKGFSKTEILDISGHSESQLKEIGIV